MTRFSLLAAATAAFTTALACAPAASAQTLPKKPQSLQGLEVRKADDAAPSAYFEALIAAGRSAAERQNTTSCFADRGDIILTADGLGVYCDGDISDGDGRMLDYKRAVPQLYILSGTGRGALTPSTVLEAAQAASVRNLTKDSQLGESRFLVQGIAPNGNTACPAWASPIIAARGETQCRTLTMAQSWAMQPVPKTQTPLPPATVRFTVQESDSRPPLQCRRAGC